MTNPPEENYFNDRSTDYNRKFNRFFAKVDVHFKHVTGRLLGWKLLEGTQFQAGSSSIVIRFNTRDGTFVYRAPRLHPLQLRRINLAYHHFGKFEFMPKKIYLDEKCVIEEYLEGDLILESDDPSSYFQKLGACLSQLHCLTSSGYGQLTNDCKGLLPEIWDLFDQRLDKGLYHLENMGSLSSGTLKELKRRFESMPEAADPSPVVSHGDLAGSNVMCTEGSIKLIDWDMIGSYPREYDFSFLNHGTKNREHFRLMLDAYTHPINRELVDWLSLANLTRLLTSSDSVEHWINYSCENITQVLENPCTDI